MLQHHGNAGKWRFGSRALGSFFALICTAGLATAANIKSDIATAGSPQPLTIREMLLVPDLQLSPNDAADASVGWKRGYGVQLGGWSYSIIYRNTRIGWQVASYSVTAVSSGTSGQQADRYRLREKLDSGDGFHLNFIKTDPVLPPGGSVIPQPDTPADPTKPKNVNGSSCPVVPGFDAKFHWKWVPTHTETDEWGNEFTVPGHWELRQYTMAFAPSGFCK